MESPIASHGILTKVAEYLSAEDLAHAAMVSHCFHQVCRNDSLWQKLCTRYGLRSLTSVTRTRGKKSYKSIYVSSLCNECRKLGTTGTVVIDTNGGRMYNSSRHVDGPSSSLFTLCSECFAEVRKMNTWSLRVKHALPKCKNRIPALQLNALLNKIPYEATNKKLPKDTIAPSSSSSSRNKRSIDYANHNDYLLNQLRKSTKRS